MDENARKKREWVKTAAIIFLSVMLVLTFFSNTIMNYSLPEVAIQYVQSGTVTAKIRGTGIVESGDPYNIEVTESRKVSGVAVHVGDFVEKGDVILYLEDEESEELKAAQEALDQAWREYEKALLSENITAADIAAANGNTSTATYRQRITNAQKAVDSAQKRVDELEAQLNDLTRQKTSAVGGDMRDIQEWYNNASTALEYAQNALSQAQADRDLLVSMGGSNGQWYKERDYYEKLSVSSNDPAVKKDALEKVKNLNANISNYSKNLLDAEAAIINAQSELNYRTADYNNAKAALNGETSDLDSQIAAVNAELTIANSTVQDKQDALTELTGMIVNAYGLQDYMDAIDKAQEEVDKLTEKSIDAVVTADISGTITAINVTAGSTTSAATPVAVMQPEGKGYTMSFSVTNEQATRLAVGDRAELVNAWRYDDVEVVLASIRPDKDDPGQKKLLTFDVTGAVTPGQSFSISVGQKSANFDYIVPNSSIREDNNGKFILVVTAKPGPLSTRYIATRVDVEVLASDDSQSAVSTGMLGGYDPVITTATKPVEAGMQVRLSDN